MKNHVRRTPAGLATPKKLAETKDLMKMPVLVRKNNLSRKTIILTRKENL